MGALESRLLALQGRHACPQEGDLVIDLFDRRLEPPPLAAGQAQDASNLGLGGLLVGLGVGHRRFLDIDLHLVRFTVELDQQVPLLHAIIVIHQDTADLASDTGSHEGHMAVDVGVIGGDGIQHRHHHGVEEIPSHEQAEDGPVDEQPVPPAMRPRARGRRGRRIAARRPRDAEIGMGGPLGLGGTRAIPHLGRHGPGSSRSRSDRHLRASIALTLHVGTSPRQQVGTKTSYPAVSHRSGPWNASSGEGCHPGMASLDSSARATL